MTPNENTEELIDLIRRWHQSHDNGEALSAEQLCEGDTRKREQLQQHLQAVASMISFMEITSGDSPNDSQWQEQTKPDLSTSAIVADPQTIIPTPSIPGYEIIEELGRGGMGVVYKARQVALKRLVALKMILAGGHASAQDLQRFRVEAQAVARLQHPNIVQIHEIGEHEGKPFFSLEYVGGGSLVNQFAGDPQPPRQAAELIRAVALAMEAAHAAGVVHRDLKPGNILLTPQGQLKVTDFGLAKQIDSRESDQKSAEGLTASGSILGTPSYMAPEQADGRNEDIGPTTDIWALGAMLYAGLTGRPPFRGSNVLDTLEQVRRQEPVPPGRLVAGVPRDLETICLKCLQKDQRKRYSSARELADDLGRFLAGEPIRARPIGSLERVWRLARRNPRVAALLASFALVIVAAWVGMTLLWRQAVANETFARRQQQRAEAHAAEANRQGQIALANEGEALRQKGIAETNFKKAAEQQQLAERNFQEALTQKQAAETEHRRALAEADKARQVSTFLAGMFEASDPIGLNGISFYIPKDQGESLTARDILARGAERVAQDPSLSPETRAMIQDRIGNVYLSLGMIQKAEDMLRASLAAREKLLPPEHPDLASSLHNLGWLLHMRGLHEESAGLYKRTLAIREKLPQFAAEAATTRLNLGWIYTELQDYQEGERLIKQAVEERTRLLGDGHRETAVARLGLAALYLDRGEPALALPVSQQAIKDFLAQANDETLSKAVGLFQQSVIADHLLGDQNTAEKLLEECLDICRKGLPARHPYLAFPLVQLGIVEASREKYDEAEAHLAEAVEIARTKVGFTHPKAPMVLDVVDDVYQKRGKTAQAEELWQEHLSAMKSTYGTGHFRLADSLTAYADFLNDLGKDGEEGAILEEALGIYRAGNWMNRSRVVVCLSRLGWNRYRADRIAEAEALFRERLAIVQKRAGKNDWDLGFAHNAMAQVLLKQNKHDDQVQTHLDRALDNLQPAVLFGEAPGERSDALLNYAWLYRLRGRLAESADKIRASRSSAGKRAGDVVAAAREFAILAAVVGKDTSNLTPLEKQDRQQYIDEAIASLRRAVSLGYRNAAHLQREPAFAPLRDTTAFQKVLEEMR